MENGGSPYRKATPREGAFPAHGERRMDLTARKGTEDLSPRIGDAANSHLSDAVLNGGLSPRMEARSRGSALPAAPSLSSAYGEARQRISPPSPSLWRRCPSPMPPLGVRQRARASRRAGLWFVSAIPKCRYASTPGARGFSSIRKPPLTASEGYSRSAGSFAAEVRFHDLADGILPERGEFRVHDRLTAFRAAGLRSGMTS